MPVTAINNPAPEAPDTFPTKLERGGYLGTAQTLDQKIDENLAAAKLLIESFKGTAFLGSITPASAATGTGRAFWLATEAGPYPDYGGFTVGANSFAVFSRNEAGVFSISQTALDLSTYASKSYVDGLVVGLLDDRGSYNASVNTFPTTGGSGTAGAVMKGDLWYVSVAGTLGGKAVKLGSSFRALVDTPAQVAANWALIDTALGFVPENTSNKNSNIAANPTSTDQFPTNKAVVDYVAANGGKIKPFIDGAWPADSQVNFLGKDWHNTVATVAGEIPGTSSKWVDRLTGYIDIIDVTTEYPLSAGSFYNFASAVAVIPIARRKNNIRITYQTSSDNWENARFIGLVAKWFDPIKWSVERITNSKINLVTSNAIESTRRTIRAKVEGGKRYLISNKVTFDTIFTSGFNNASSTKVGEINYNTNPVIFDSVTNRFYKVLGVDSPATAVEIYIIYSTDTDNSEFQIEEGLGFPSFYETPLVNDTFVSKEKNSRDLSKKIENISQIPEIVTSSKNLYNPYTRLTVKVNTDGTKMFTSDFIEIEELADYYYTRPFTANSSYFQVFDINKVLLRGVNYPYMTSAVGEKYVKLLQANGTTDTLATNQVFQKLNAPIQFEKSKFPTAYVPRFQIEDYQLKSRLPSKFQTELFTNKICYELGDSITNAGLWTTPFALELKIGKNIVLGRDGAEWTDINVDNNDIKNRIDALETSVAINGIPDIIVIALGTNDWGNLRSIGDYAATMAKAYADVQARLTVYDAVKYGVTRIKKLYPNAFIVLVTPIQRAGRYDTDYIDAIVKAGKMMSVPVIDAYSNSGLIPYDEWLTLYYQDGLHETALGGQIHGKYLANELLNVYYKK